MQLSYAPLYNRPDVFDNCLWLYRCWCIAHNDFTFDDQCGIRLAMADSHCQSDTVCVESGSGSDIARFIYLLKTLQHTHIKLKHKKQSIQVEKFST